MINRWWSTAGFLPPSILTTNYTVRASEESFRTVLSIHWRARKREGCLRAGSSQRRPVLRIQPRPAPPPRRAPPRPDRPVVCPGFKFEIYELYCSLSRRDVHDSCLGYSGGHEGQISPGRVGPSTSLPDRPCASPPRIARAMSGFGTRHVESVFVAVICVQ